MRVTHNIQSTVLTVDHGNSIEDLRMCSQAYMFLVLLLKSKIEQIDCGVFMELDIHM